MKKEDLLSDYLLKQFKTSDELYGFLPFPNCRNAALRRCLRVNSTPIWGMKSMKEKPPPMPGTKTPPRKQGSLSGSQNPVPRDREASFNPILMPKIQHMLNELKNVIIPVCMPKE